MLVAKPVGRNASSQKYDILTALSVHALSSNKFVQRTILRIIALITARYNWQRNELSMGQREIAKLWSVDERTVKRELNRFRELEWIDVKRAGARGRVNLYQFNLSKIIADTRESWDNVGADFVDRMEVTPKPVQKRENVVPFPTLEISDANEPVQWRDLKERLHDNDPATYASWFSKLEYRAIVDNRLILHAPSRFHANYVRTHLLETVERCVSDAKLGINSVEITDM